MNRFKVLESLLKQTFKAPPVKQKGKAIDFYLPIEYIIERILKRKSIENMFKKPICDKKIDRIKRKIKARKPQGIDVLGEKSIDQTLTKPVSKQIIKDILAVLKE